MRYIASIDTEPPTSEDFTDPDAAITWAEANAGGLTWVVSELPDEPGPPRIVASRLADDIETVEAEAERSAD